MEERPFGVLQLRRSGGHFYNVLFSSSRWDIQYNADLDVKNLIHANVTVNVEDSLDIIPAKESQLEDQVIWIFFFEDLLNLQLFIRRILLLLRMKI